jgi:hypothetical protein
VITVLINHLPEPMSRIRPILLAFVAISAFQWSADAERLSLKYGLTRPFYAPALNVQWAAPTNDLPSTVIVFHLVADEHPGVTVSNLMTIGRFRLSDRVMSFDREMRIPKYVYAFRAADDARTLVYFPRQGRIDFDNQIAFHGPGSDEKVEGVPDEAAALRLAVQVLPQIGISTNDMVKAASGIVRCVFPTGSWGRADKDSGREVSYIDRRGVGFTRSLDGKEVDGQRAVFVEHGNDAVLGRLQVRWPTLRPKGSYPVATPSQILRWIREGRATVSSLSGPTDARYVRVADIRKLTVTSIQPRYPGMDEDNPPKFVYPYAFLTARAEFGTNDSEQVFLYCPLIAEGLPKAQRPAHAYFSIYPSSRSHREQ